MPNQIKHLVKVNRLSKELALWGCDLLSYILNISNEEANELINSGGQVDSQTKQAIAILDSMAKNIYKIKKTGITLDCYDILYSKNFKNKETNQHIFSFLKSLFKEIKKPNYDDKVLSSFYDLTIESYPFTLFPVSDKFAKISMTVSHYTHIAYNEFISSIKNDMCIMRLFPEDCGKFNKSYEFTVDTKDCISKDSIQLGLFYDMLFDKSYTLMRIHNKNSFDDLMHYAEKVLNDIRSLINGGEIKVPLIMGIHGIRIKNDINIKFGNGIITNMHSGITDVYPKVIENTRYKDSLIYILEVPYKITVLKNKQNKKTFNKNKENKLDINKIVSDISLSISLMSTKERIIPSIDCFSFTFEPLRQGSSITYLTTIGKNISPVELLNSEIETASELFAVINKTDDNNIKLAKKRLQTSLSMRNDYSDSLVDAMIGLENIFGDRSEIAFSIASAVSKLLGKSKLERVEIFDRVKKLYGIRSNIVHGGIKEKDEKDMKNHADDTIMFLINTLKVLYLKHSDLINEEPAKKLRYLITY